MARKSPKPLVTFEDRMARLEELVHELEAGSLPLEQSVVSFEEGMKLVKQLGATLDNAERRIEVLLADADGTVQAKPFDPPAADDADDPEPEEEPD